MKKNVLALSITAALVGLGFAGTGVAAATSSPSAVVDQGMLAKVDHTMINTNFPSKMIPKGTLGADKTGDVFDFQVFLAPADVWSVNTPLTSGAAGIRVFKDT